jgi:photosystem II stability/assembly factor-like uncharacterized protein
MNNYNFQFGRRVLMSAAGAAFIAVPRMGKAQSLAGFNPLTMPAIPAKSPASVLLVSVTQTPAKRLVAVGEHGVIIYSDDEGASWIQARVPVSVTITCVAFATPMVGWAAGQFGVILATTDGGKTWMTQLDGNQANQMTLMAAKNPDVQEKACPCEEFALKRATFFIEAGADKPFLSLLVLSPQEVIVFGAYRLAMRTADGGKTWADWSLHIYDRFSHNIYSAAVIGSNYYIVGEQGLVFASTDHCTTFLPLAPTSSITLFGVLRARDNSLIVYGVAGTAFRSTDAGQTWSRIALNVQDNITSGYLLASGMIMLASESGALLQSMDNGTTFEAISDITPVPIFDIQEITGGSLITVGAEGVVRIPKSVLTS